MTVQELIEQLQSLDGGLQVLTDEESPVLGADMEERNGEDVCVLETGF